ncbi:hypothetical protein WJX72_011591 [[Myrmecia] bisecta]|uniref:Molybdenum cofactor sulfurase n=1 Tax=[Myrmecia] bisecta TaxID=41462 RepID=A0AAW1PDH2_9CHLO
MRSRHMSREAAFIQQYGSLYGYSGRIDALRREEFARLGSKVYVDHAGATLYSETQMQAVMQDYMVNMYSNPHSQHAGFGERGSADAEADARAMTLAMCNASPAEYECIFTSGATAALKLVADSFPWAAGSQFAYTLDNHNSVLGMREVAMKGGASAIAVTASHTGTGDWDLQQASEVMAAAATSAVPAAGASDGGDGEGGAPGCMFAFPVESNFNGARLDLSLVQQVQQQGLMGHRGRWRVLLDAAKACATAPPDLSRYPADFMVLSFYKIFGYPTGLGALIVRKDALQLLQPTYFGGGTVEVSVADARFHRKRKGAAGFEDGTTSYLAYAALRHGFAQIQKLGGFHNIQLHTDSLTRYLTSQLTNLRHANGSPGCVLYGSGSTSRHGRNGTSQGPVVAFNLLRRDGLFVGYREVEKMAGLCSIYLRTGCFCNPGACALHLGLSAGQLKRNFEAGHVCWDDNDVIDGRPTGAVRVSFGYMSTFEDADAVLRFIAHVGAWPLGPNGLLYDREWALVDEAGDALKQKKVPKMTAIMPSIDLQTGVMTVAATCMPTALQIPLPRSQTYPAPAGNGGHEGLQGESGGALPGTVRHVRICADNVCSLQAATVAGDSLVASTWFSEALGVRCHLVQQQPGSRSAVPRHLLRKGLAEPAAPQPGLEQHEGDNRNSSIGFANEGQFLLTSATSMADVNARLAAKDLHLHIDAARYRPNLVVAGPSLQPYAEDAWDTLAIGGLRFREALESESDGPVLSVGMSVCV